MFRKILEKEQLKSITKDKNICLIGNATSVFSNEKDINKYEVICRCNESFPFKDVWIPDFEKYEKFIGTRTDVLFVSGVISPDSYYKNFLKPKIIISTRGPRRHPSKWFLENSFDWPSESFELKKKIHVKYKFGKKTYTTGLYAFYYLLRTDNFKSFTIYGFDFFRTGELAETRKNVNIREITYRMHCPDKEEEYIMDCIKKDNRIKLVNEA